MFALNQGTIRLFRLAGINVYLHWSWFLVAVYMITQPSGNSSILLNALVYLSLFGIVLMHEFGHALACRQVGGRAERIVLWPLGGVAFVAPPPRPGAILWSIAAGPLVNVALMPVFALLIYVDPLGWATTSRSAYAVICAIAWVNFVILKFNLIPVYPLDGGQILRALLWFVVGPARSLIITTVIGFLGVVGFVLYAFKEHSLWLGVVAAFILMCCWQGLRQGLALARIARKPRRAGYACPACGVAPILGPYWLCGQCHQPFDTFETQAVCPHCGTGYAVTRCMNCGAQHPIREWMAPTMPPPLP